MQSIQPIAWNTTMVISVYMTLYIIASTNYKEA